MFSAIITKFFSFIGSLCLLLFGMDMLSNGIQKGSRKSLQKLLNVISGNRFSAVFTGFAITAIIQSSSATTVMVVSFVNAGIMNLTQAIGVIFGANIGTTVTAWIVSLFGFSFSVFAISIPLFGIGFILKKFKKFKIHNFSDVFMGFGLLFCGLDFLSKSVSLNADSVQFLQNFTNLGFGGIILGVLAGAFFTAIIHSSSAMTAIILTMAFNGSLSWELSAALVLGSNIGTTIDAILSSLEANTNAKRAAFVHVLFNIAGTFLALCVFNHFLKLIDLIVPGTPQENITTHISMLHTVFNICATLVFLPFTRQIADLVSHIIKGEDHIDSAHYKFPIIFASSHAGVEFYISQIQKEIHIMTRKVMDMFDVLYNALINLKSTTENQNEHHQRINLLEDYVDQMKDSITDFLLKCERLPSVNSNMRKLLTQLIHHTDGLEVLSDERCSLLFSIGKLDKSSSIDEDFHKIIIDYFEEVRVFFEYVAGLFILGITNEQKEKTQDFENKIDKRKKQLKKDIRKRIENGENVKEQLYYLDVVRKIEKTGDYIYALVNNQITHQ